MGLTINYGAKPKVEAPAPLPKAPSATKSYDAAVAICGQTIVSKLYKKGLIPYANDKLLMVVTKQGQLVYSSDWPGGMFQQFKQAAVGGNHVPVLQNFMTNTLNQGFLHYEAFLAKQEAAIEAEFKPISQSLEGAAKALNITYATGSEPCVKLRNATKMYQPVNGSDPGSRYFLVAMTEDMKFAARMLNGMLSLRAEGPGIGKHKDELTAAGFSKFGTDYASVHLQVMGDKVLAQKSLGAVLFGLGLTIKTPWPDVNKCEGT